MPGDTFAAFDISTMPRKYYDNCQNPFLPVPLCLLVNGVINSEFIYAPEAVPRVARGRVARGRAPCENSGPLWPPY